MDLPTLSLLALVVTLLLSCTSAINPGVLAIVLAWLIGGYVAPMMGKPIGLEKVVAGFPRDLFLTLVGVTLLFSEAQANGTLDRVARAAVRTCRGNVGLMPVAFFALALGIATIGAGNIASAALVAPMAMAVAGRAGIPAFLMAIMVAHGAIGGALSPFAPTGIIADRLMTQADMPGHQWPIYVSNLLANAGVGLAGYLAFGGWRLFRRKHDDEAVQVVQAEPLRTRHVVTILLIAGLIVGVIGCNVHVGMGAFAAAAVLVLLRLTDERDAVRSVPWSVILMVCGVTVLTSLLEKTGGIELFTRWEVRLASRTTITAVSALVTGIISVYSSTSGVVLPVFLPTVRGMVHQLGGGNPLAIASSMIVGGHLVDSSPLSTIGALCVASAAAHEDRRRLFNQTLAWGLSMCLVGAVICFFAFPAS